MDSSSASGTHREGEFDKTPIPPDCTADTGNEDNDDRLCDPKRNPTEYLYNELIPFWDSCSSYNHEDVWESLLGHLCVVDIEKFTQGAAESLRNDSRI